MSVSASLNRSLADLPPLGPTECIYADAIEVPFHHENACRPPRILIGTGS